MKILSFRLRTDKYNYKQIYDYDYIQLIFYIEQVGDTVNNNKKIRRRKKLAEFLMYLRTQLTKVVHQLKNLLLLNFPDFIS